MPRKNNNRGGGGGRGGHGGGNFGGGGRGQSGAVKQMIRSQTQKLESGVYADNLNMFSEAV